jgi:hypothetical protein
MMKKLMVFLILLTVLCSSASALLQISVGGEKNPVDSEIVLAPSDHIMLDIWNDETLTASNTPITLALIVDATAGNMDGGVPQTIGDSVIFSFDTDVVPQPIGAGKTGMWGGVTVFTTNIAAGSTLIDLIDFHCVGPLEALIQLIQLDNVTGIPTGVIYDEVSIHQPEPMTIALLGLGGLFLRRRK